MLVYCPFLLSLTERGGALRLPHIPPVASVAGREAASGRLLHFWRRISKRTSISTASISTTARLQEDPLSLGQRPQALRAAASEKHRRRNQILHGTRERHGRTILTSRCGSSFICARLRTVPGVSIHLGHFLSHEVTMPLAVQSGPALSNMPA